MQEHSNKIRMVGVIARITPACAGTLNSSNSAYHFSGDHPCVCRNILSFYAIAFADLGSPLRVQEHSFKRTNYNAIVGITPACAGTFYSSRWKFSKRRDHPCVCRNILKLHLMLLEMRGSPLRVQEHCCFLFFFVCFAGITPACAGTFLSIQLGLNLVGDHPCVCRNIFKVRARK